MFIQAVLNTFLINLSKTSKKEKKSELDLNKI